MLGKEQDLGLEGGDWQVEGLFIPSLNALPSVLFPSASPIHFPFSSLPCSYPNCDNKSHTSKAPSIPQVLAEAIHTV